MAEYRHLLPGDIVQHLGQEEVTPFTAGVSADDVGLSFFRLPVDGHRAAAVLPPDLGHIVAVLPAPPLHRLRQAAQPFRDRLPVEDRLARHAPFPQAIDLVIIGVRVLESLQGPHRLRRQEAVVLVGAAVGGGPWVRRIEKAPLEPVGDADGVEGEDDLEVVGEPGAEADVQLIEVRLRDLAGLLHPDAGDVVDGLQLFHVVQPREEDLRPVGEADAHVAYADLRPGFGIMGRDLAPQLGKAGFPQRPGHLPAHQPAVALFRGEAFQHLAPGEDALAGPAAPAQHQIPVLVEEQGEKGRVGAGAQGVVPAKHAGLPGLSPLPHPPPPGAAPSRRGSGVPRSPGSARPGLPGGSGCGR